MLIQVFSLIGIAQAQITCGPNSQYRSCGNPCFEQKCCENGGSCYGTQVGTTSMSTWLEICTNNCTPRCECKSGYFRDPNSNECVMEFQCTKSAVCDTNEYWNECGNSCKEEQCSDLINSWQTIPTEKKCSTVCEPRCQCRPGFYRDDNGKCVEECPDNTCLANETFVECGNACKEPTCSVPDTSTRKCKTGCTARCQCNDGFVRDQQGHCVELSQCPTNYCPKNEHYVGCKNPCDEQTCANTKCYKTSSACVDGCQCIEGTFRDSISGRCIEASQCGTCSGFNEEWTSCGNVCREPTCDDDRTDAKCPTMCQRRCQCKLGFVRNKTGDCVRSEFCPSGHQRCKANEFWNSCGNVCKEPTCEYPLGNSIEKCGSTPTVCTARCECLAGYVRQYGKCIPATECEATCDPVKEVFSTCGNSCTESKCPGIKSDKCSTVCERRCECKEGYKRDHLGECVKEKDCVVPPCGTNEVRECISSPCEDTSCLVAWGKEECFSTEEFSPCESECICQSGYARNDQGNCIPVDECMVCGANEQKVDHYCGDCMENQCPGGIVCMCVPEPDAPKTPGCMCKAGFVRDADGNCASEESVCIEDPRCKANEELVENWCPCLDDRCNSNAKCSCGPTGESVCMCKHGFKRQGDDCIPEAECSKECHGVGEQWYDCHLACTDRYCGQPYSPCLPDCSTNTGGCGCMPGLARDTNGNCVQKCSEPEPETCLKNEVEESCYHPCMDTCDGNCKHVEMKKCKKSDKGCRCIEGYARNQKGKCVPKDTGVCCGTEPNTQWNICSNIHQESKCPSYQGRNWGTPMIINLNATPAPRSCEPRCECLVGFHRSEQGCVSNCANVPPEGTKQECGCDVSKVMNQILGEGVKRAECTKKAKKGSKGSEWTLSCLLNGTTKHGMHGVKMGKNCQLSKTLRCGYTKPGSECNCGHELQKFKDIKCNGNHQWSCTGRDGSTITFKAKKANKCGKLVKKCKCALK